MILAPDPSDPAGFDFFLDSGVGGDRSRWTTLALDAPPLLHTWADQAGLVLLSGLVVDGSRDLWS
ncbi:MAG: hypothetical protein VKO39_06035 [Cyanobacteriota bacterium]|nr:hypothetical protein [Cyanobacteriota bacterium]